MWHTFSKYLCHSKHTHAVIQNPERKPPPQPSEATCIVLAILAPSLPDSSTSPRPTKTWRNGEVRTGAPGFYWSGTGFQRKFYDLCHLCHLCPIFESPTPHNTHSSIWKRMFTLLCALVEGLSFWYLKHTNQRCPTSLLNSDKLTEQQKIHHFQ